MESLTNYERKLKLKNPAQIIIIIIIIIIIKRIYVASNNKRNCE
jgi:hypothetical protein